VPVPAIAIHGSGSSEKIARALRANFEDSTLYDSVVAGAFDWDRAAPRRPHRGTRNLYRFLKRTAASISVASRLGMEFRGHFVDGLLGKWQVHLHRALQWLVAALVAIWFALPVLKFVVLAPAAWYGLPTVTFAPMEWLARGLIWAKLGLAAGVTALIGMSVLRMLLTGSARPAIVTFRSVALLFFQPVLIVGFAALTADVSLLVAAVTVFGISAFFIAGLGAAMAWAGALCVLMVLRSLWVRESLKGPAKVLLDAFRYLGEPGYRERIQHALEKIVEEARVRTGEDEDFILVAQGLGTIFAIDSLLHSRAWRRTDRVLLVTMGSPLRRYFLRFYPRTLFPEYMDNVVDAVANRLRELRWMNVYHPGDYLGTSLGLAQFNGRDVATGRAGHVIHGAEYYWMDLDTRKAFRRGLHRLESIEALHLPMREAAHRMPHPPVATPQFQIPEFARRPVAAGLALSTFGWILWWVATASGALTLGPKDTLADSDRGVLVEATATHSRETVAGARGLTFVHHWEFAFTDPNGVPTKVQVDRDASDAFLKVPHRFDDRALAREMHAACTGLPAWLPPKDMDRPCTMRGVRLRYYPGNMTLFDLPDFPRQRLGGDVFKGWSEAAVVAIVLSLLAMIPLSVGVRLFDLFL
jgi:hypothetical protein